VTNTLWKINATAQNTTWSWGYDLNGRNTGFTVPLPSSTATVTFDYDLADRITQYTVPSGLGGGRSQTVSYTSTGHVYSVLDGSMWRYYNHDYHGQILREGTGVGQNDINEYTYDAAGNRLSDNISTYVYSSGRLQSRNMGALGTVTYTHNAAGSQVRQSNSSPTCSSGSPLNLERELVYTADGRVAHSRRWVNRPPNGCQLEERNYWYDGLGRLVLIRSTNQWADDYGVTRFWWLDDDVAVRFWKPLNDADSLWVPRLKRNSSGVLEAMGQWYYPGPGPDRALASFNYQAGPGVGTGDRHLFLRDWRGSVIKVTEHTGVLHGGLSQDYEAFGSADGAVARNGPGYNGAPSIDGFQYLRNRWYDPTVGRFTQEDPIGFAGGINLYAYVGSNPLMFSDPYGLCPPELTGRPCGSPLASPLGTSVRHMTIRSDAHGDGAFDASRGTRGAHRALDVNAAVGTPVVSMDQGRVLNICRENCGTGGMSVTVGHYNNDGKLVSRSYYAHLSSIDAGLRENQGIHAGTRLGAAGQTGNAAGTDPHLHVSLTNTATGEKIKLEDQLDVSRRPE
jgi:RHS repeat-associated protein